jgi:hypothetical protein
MHFVTKINKSLPRETYRLDRGCSAQGGRHPDPDRRRRVEECHVRLSVRQWLDGVRPADAGWPELVFTWPHFGGKRAWFACPQCGRRVGMLYQPLAGDPWACRRCHALAYRSSQEAHLEDAVWVARARLYRYLKANNGWGEDWEEKLLDGLNRSQQLVMLMTMIAHHNRISLQSMAEQMAALKTRSVPTSDHS